MKFTRVTLLSALIAVGSFMPVKASDDALKDATAPMGTPVIVDAATRAFWQNPYIIACGSAVLIIGTAAATWFAKDQLDNREIARTVALSKQESENKINEQKYAQTVEQEKQKSVNLIMMRYKTVRDKLKHFEHIDSLSDSEFLTAVECAAANIDEPIDDILTTLNSYLNNELNSFPHDFPFNHEIELLKKIAQHTRSKIVSTPLITQKRLEQQRLALEAREKQAALKRLESIATYEQLQAQQKKEEIEQQQKLFTSLNQHVDSLFRRQSTFEHKCNETLNTLQQGVNDQTNSISKQQDAINRQQAFVSEQYGIVISGLRGLATSEQAAKLTTAIDSVSKGLGNESAIMKLLVTLQKNQQAQDTELTAQHKQLHEVSAQIRAIENHLAKLQESTSMHNPSNWDAQKSPAVSIASKATNLNAHKSTAPTTTASEKADPAKETARLDPSNENAD